jgi:hypothetical protein
MLRTQKAYNNIQVNSDEDKVYIPEIIEESDSESDSFGERLRNHPNRVANVIRSGLCR